VTREDKDTQPISGSICDNLIVLPFDKNISKKNLCSSGWDIAGLTLPAAIARSSTFFELLKDF
jgi:hypothetical protein